MQWETGHAQRVKMQPLILFYLQISSKICPLALFSWIFLATWSKGPVSLRFLNEIILPSYVELLFAGSDFATFCEVSCRVGWTWCMFWCLLVARSLSGVDGSFLVLATFLASTGFCCCLGWVLGRFLDAISTRFLEFWTCGVSAGRPLLIREFRSCLCCCCRGGIWRGLGVGAARNGILLGAVVAIRGGVIRLFGGVVISVVVGLPGLLVIEALSFIVNGLLLLFWPIDVQMRYWRKSDVIRILENIIYGFCG